MTHNETTIVTDVDDHTHRYKTLPFSAIWFSYAANTLTLVMALGLYAYALRNDRLRRRLAPRLSQEDAAGLAFPFGWMRLAMSPQQQLLDAAGLDGVVLVRFLDLGFKFCVLGVLLCAALVPMYGFSHCGEVKFKRWTLSNIACAAESQSSVKFQVVVGAAYLLNAGFYHFMVGEWANFLNFKKKRFKQMVLGSLGNGPAQASRSVLVENVPKELRSAEALHRYFERQFGQGSVHSVVVQSDTRAMHRIEDCCTSSLLCCCRASERLETMRERVRPDVAWGTQLCDLSAGRRARRTTCKVDESSLLSGLDLPVVAREFSRKVKTYTTSLAGTFAKALPATELVRSSISCSSTAFVTFATVQTRVLAAQVLLSHRSHWQIRAAPEARDMVWSNASTPWKLSYPRTIVAKVLCVIGVLFWSLPVTAIQAWSNVEGWSNLKIKFLAWLTVDSQNTCRLCRTFMDKYLPVVTLIMLLSLLPFIFELISFRYERFKVKSELHRMVLNRYFGYLMATLYVAVVTGSVWNTFELILREPPQALEKVRNEVPKVAIYFITFVLARVGISLPMALFNPGLFKRPSHCYFATEASDAAMVLVLGLTYSTVAPLIMPACALYFALATVFYRWLFLYVYEPEFDCAGNFWYDLFNCSVFGLFCSNVTLMSLAALKGDFTSYSFIATALLPVGTIVFKAYCERRYAQPSRHIALEDAVQADEQAAEREEEEDQYINLDYEYYVDPILISRSSPTSSSCSTTPTPSNQRLRFALGSTQSFSNAA